MMKKKTIRIKKLNKANFIIDFDTKNGQQTLYKTVYKIG
jgi:hypothetical protein